MAKNFDFKMILKLRRSQMYARDERERKREADR